MCDIVNVFLFRDIIMRSRRSAQYRNRTKSGLRRMIADLRADQMDFAWLLRASASDNFASFPCFLFRQYISQASFSWPEAIICHFLRVRGMHSNARQRQTQYCDREVGSWAIIASNCIRIIKQVRVSRKKTNNRTKNACHAVPEVNRCWFTLRYSMSNKMDK